MFGNNKKSNPFILRMEDYEKSAYQGSLYGEGCSLEIIPMIKEFFKKSREAKIEWTGTKAWNIEKTTQIVMHLASNTHAAETINESDIQIIKKIFDDLYLIHDEVLAQKDNNSTRNWLTQKIEWIDEIVVKNAVNNHNRSETNSNIHDGKIFQSYESLYKVIHTINTEYNELLERGFSLTLFYDFWRSFEYDRMVGSEKSETEKLNMFLGLLDGTMKFQPIYEHKAVAYEVVPVSCNKILNKHVKTNYSTGYQLPVKVL